jgi:hypothetical protein
VQTGQFSINKLNFFFFYVGSIYKVFDLKNYNFLYQISDDNVQEIKIRFTSICFFSLMHLM